MEFLHGDGWERQCECTRCNHSWLNEGWVCPVEYYRERYLQHLDRIFNMAGHTAFELGYVDWEGAVRRLHDMYTAAVVLCPQDIVRCQAVLLEYAEASSRFVREEFL